VAVGAAASAANGGAAFGDGAVATGANATALGPNASATAANAVSIGAGSTNSVANTVSVGTAGNERRITNVAAGVSPTDAVNVGQLNSVAAGFASELGLLQSQLIDNQREARRGIASAMAMTPAAMPSGAGKTSWAMNTAAFRGEFAFGGGVAHRLDTNVPLALTAGYSFSGGNNHGARVGMAGEF
jgi:autotransporter adhesin